jgi:hypothetical protein
MTISAPPAGARPIATGFRGFRAEDGPPTPARILAPLRSAGQVLHKSYSRFRTAMLA